MDDSVALSRLSVKYLLSHSTEAFRRGARLCFRNILVSKNFMDKRGTGVSRFSVENSLSHSAEKFRWGAVRSSRKFRVSKSFMHKTGISRFSIDYFLSHGTQTFRRGSLRCFRNIGYRKILCIRGVYQNHQSKLFVSQYRKTS